ncbi:MAG: 2TM domain-containing protein [Burkholderiales bacterium]|nr:2TM domain-containing protein [Burkholderiales bacterium]
MTTTNHTPMSPEEIDRLARRRAGAKLGWYFHAAVYVVVNLFLFAMSEQGFGNRAWSVKPLLGWGLGLALHGASVWLLGAGSSLRERMVQKEREALQRNNQRPDQP